MSGIQPQALTNKELARLVDNNGVVNAPPELLQHVALRFIELFRNGAANEYSGNKVTPVPFIAR